MTSGKGFQDKTLAEKKNNNNKTKQTKKHVAWWEVVKQSLANAFANQFDVFNRSRSVILWLYTAHKNLGQPKQHCVLDAVGRLPLSFIIKKKKLYCMLPLYLFARMSHKRLPCANKYCRAGIRGRRISYCENQPDPSYIFDGDFLSVWRAYR